jgi:hypothetical protein
MSEAAEAYPRIPRRTLHEEVLERLRDMIIEGRWSRVSGLTRARLGSGATPTLSPPKSLRSFGLGAVSNRGREWA